MNLYPALVRVSSDIHQHMPTLRLLSTDCVHITEFGVREVVSTWAFADGITKGGTLVSVDRVQPLESSLEEVREFMKENGSEFQFILGDTTKISIEPTDMLFVDTTHTAKQLEEELRLHAPKVRKYIVLHDTTSCGQELWAPILNFIGDGWMIRKIYVKNNGLMILQRVW